ncbi:hypothetical protein A2159_02940 [Candidatus Woesebacteria bacterium RBG_13_34_9]|uniref:Glycosyl transferase family 1 domain-containing protein n=1 Tax=Candidatus Woesebacteria bacterium RBG_13_34_9 TaxID=1802477 RepID=A0A1F7X6V7_9BACT|nr:MAG: hypothetical protein A2159_02940 [Candidatus Woesebacteria bacterium RBG_13_34_9]
MDKKTQKKPPKSKKIRICAFELGKTDKNVIGGGDLILPQMSKHFPSNLELLVIIPHLAIKNWEKFKNKKLLILPKMYLESKSHPVFIFFLYLLRSLQASKIAKETRTDFFYSSTNIFPDVLAAYLAKKTTPTIPWVARIHHVIPSPFKRKGNFLNNLFSFALDKLALTLIKSRADLTFVLNNNLNEILNRKGFKNLKTLGVGVSVPKKSTKTKKEYDAVSIGRIHPTKGIFDLPLIWKIVIQKQPHARLIIVGEGRLKDKLKKSISDLNLEKNIILAGYLSESRKINILKKSKVFLFTDHEAGWGLGISEAMAHQTPVIAYKHAFINEIYPKGLFSVPLKDKRKMAEKILLLIRNENERKKVALQAFQMANTLSWEKVTEEFLADLKLIQ